LVNRELLLQNEYLAGREPQFEGTSAAGLAALESRAPANAEKDELLDSTTWLQEVIAYF
jgi:hypothetical protein